MSYGSLATVVLAAGAGTRFGGPKQLAEIDGEPLLGRVLAMLSPRPEPRIVVLGAAAEAVRGAVPSGWTVVVAADWEEGQGASLRAGLGAAPDAEAALIVLGDLAWLRPEAVERVLAAAAAAPVAVQAVRACEGDVPGHPLLIRGDLLTAARSAPAAGLRDLLMPANTLAVDCAGLGPTRDVDTPADLEPPGATADRSPAPRPQSNRVA